MKNLPASSVHLRLLVVAAIAAAFAAPTTCQIVQEEARDSEEFADYTTSPPLPAAPTSLAPPPPQQEPRQCKPMLDLQSYLSSSSASATSARNRQSKLSFQVGDIDAPITPAGGSISSAIKLFSSFGDSFDDEPEDLDEPVENVVKFRENRLQIEGLNLSMLSVHLYAGGEPNFRVGVTIKNTTLTGRFSYNGALVLGSPKLTGFYRMTIDDIYLISSSNLTKIRHQPQPEPQLQAPVEQREQMSADPSAQIEEAQFSLRTNDFKVNISDLGYISIEILDAQDSTRPMTNYLLRVLQRVLQKTIKRTYYSFDDYIRSALEREGRRFLDCELTRFSPLLSETTTTTTDKSIAPAAAGLLSAPSSQSSWPSSSGHQSDLARIISNEIVRSRLNSVQLPDFEYQQGLFGSTTRVQFHNGSLSGLDHLNLNEETRIKLQNEHLFVNTSIGWSNLRPYYSWSLLMGASSTSPISKGFVAFNIRAIDFDAVITKGLGPFSRVSVDQLIIKRLDNPKMDISGLPGMNRVTRGIVNFFMGRLKQRLVSSIQPALKQQLERSLNKMYALL